MSKLIIGLVGPIAAGKGTVAAYLKNNYQAEIFGFSSPLRDICQRLYLPQTRQNLADLSTILRSHFGSDLISRSIANDLQSSTANLVVLDGIRRFSDISLVDSLPNFILVSVTATETKRYQRLINRRQNEDDQKKTFEQFVSDQLNEADNQIPLVISKAKYSLDNNGTIEDLYQQIDNLYKKII